MIRVTLDRSVDAAKIYLRHIEPGGVAKTVGFDPSVPIFLDFDVDGVLIGVEVIVASKLLPEEVLKDAEIIG